MFNRDTLNKFSDKLAEQLTQQMGGLFGNNAGGAPMSADIQRNIKALLQSALSRLDVVTREEFDAQAAVLAQTRTKLDQMEIQLQELVNQLQTPPG